VIQTPDNGEERKAVQESNGTPGYEGGTAHLGWWRPNLNKRNVKSSISGASMRSNLNITSIVGDVPLRKKSS